MTIQAITVDWSLLAFRDRGGRKERAGGRKERARWPRSDSDAIEGVLTAKTRTHSDAGRPPCQSRSAASGQKTPYVES